jgi:predicted aspartyl protease
MRVGLLAVIACGVCLGAPELASPYRGYQLKLRPFFVPPRTVGLLVEARINGGPPLRLLLDSGAQQVVLDRRAAARSRCLGGADLDLVVPGAIGPEPGKTVSGAMVEVADLALRNVAVAVVSHRISDGIDGVLPLSFFADFLIRLDLPAKRLELRPYPSDAAAHRQTAGNNGLLFLKCVLNGTREEFFLLDTGASYNAISTKLARELSVSEAVARKVSVRGGTALMEAPVIRPDIRLRFGASELVVDSALAVDLSTASRYHNIEVAGLIGYPTLRDQVLTVNYREARVQIGTR